MFPDWSKRVHKSFSGHTKHASEWGRIAFLRYWGVGKWYGY